MKRRLMKSLMTILLTTLMFVTTVMVPGAIKASAATTYITVEEFAQSLSEELGLASIPGGQSSGYVNALIEKGIIKEGDFTSYTIYLTRTDASILLNRVDEYLYGDKLDPELVELALEKRISDISKIKESKRIDVVKCYLKGFIKGYSNGEYSTDREFKGDKKISKAGALDCIKLLKNKSLRAKISPDGQLIRTTKLPKYAKYYPYILASFPNEYYDWKFFYEGFTRTISGKDVPFVNIVDYATPVDVNKTTVYENFPEVKNKYLDIWVGKVKTHMQNVFNVDYRNIDENWMNTILETNYNYGEDTIELTKIKLQQYIKNVEKNRTIVECDKVAVDGSTLYFYNGWYYLRTHVRYRIVSSVVTYTTDINIIMNERPYNKILWSSELVDLTNFKLGEWREGYFDVRISYYNKREKENMGVAGAMLNDYSYIERRTDK